MVFDWLQQPRISKWFAPIDGVNISYEEYTDIHQRKIEFSNKPLSETHHQQYYVVTDDDGTPFGCISCYNAKHDPCFFEKSIIHPNETRDTFGIDDFYIGNEAYLNHHLGKQILTAFIERVLKPNKFIGRILIDVNPENIVAHGLYNSLGFRKIAEFDDPGYNRMIVMELL